MRIDITPGDTPIYQQIVDSIRRDIQSGALPAGHRLPTVRELADELDASRGTIKHAYDILAQLGLIEKTQGRGTFVSGPAAKGAGSKKERALLAIDALLDELQALSFSPREVRIIMDLKLREREQPEYHLRAGIIDCSPEALSIIRGQLSPLPYVDIYEYPLEPLLATPGLFDPDMDLLITTPTHYEAVRRKLPAGKNLIQMVMAIAPETVRELARLPAGEEVGILCASRRFAEIIAGTCARYASLASSPETALFSEEEEALGLLQSGRTLILPPDHLRFCSARQTALLLERQAHSPAIVFHYQMERGSLLYLEEELEKLHRAAAQKE